MDLYGHPLHIKERDLKNLIINFISFNFPLPQNLVLNNSDGIMNIENAYFTCS